MRVRTPIAFFAYKRPDHTRRALESIEGCSLADESEIHIFCDGPKTSADEKSVAEVRRVVRGRKWCRDVHIVERDSNMGLAASVTSGVTQLCETLGRVIVVEDDLVLSPHFLRFMNEALDRFVDAECVYQVAGYLLDTGKEGTEESFFLPFTTSWGWATWQRAWHHYDASAAGYEVLKNNSRMRRRFDLQGAYPCYKMLESQMSGTIDSWAIRWYLTVFMRQGLVLYPGRSLVRNEGFDRTGTHGVASLDLSAVVSDTAPTILPSEAKTNRRVLSRIIRALRSQYPASSNPLRRMAKKLMLNLSRF